MSALLQSIPKQAGGTLPYTDGTLAPDHYHNGMPYESDGTLATDATTAVAHHHMGLPMTAAGRLATTTSAPTSFNTGAAPIAGGKFCISSASLTGYLNAVGYVATEQLAIAAGAVAPMVDAGVDFDAISLTFDTAATVVAGSDPSYTMLWTIVSATTGTFTDATVEDVEFTYSGGANPVELKLTVSTDDWADVSDNVIVSIIV